MCCNDGGTSLVVTVRIQTVLHAAYCKDVTAELKSHSRGCSRLPGIDDGVTMSPRYDGAKE